MPGRGGMIGLAKLWTRRDGVFLGVELAPFWAVSAFHGVYIAGDAYGEAGRVSLVESGRRRS
jgi:hypothetical protein